MKLKTLFLAGIASLALVGPMQAIADNGQRAAHTSASTGLGANGKWAVLAGSSLRGTLQGWAAAAGWTLVWDSPVDYQIRASVTFTGDFLEAVGRLVDAVYETNPELSATLYRGNRTIHVYDLATATK
jgi:hypothetical protein